MKLQNNLFSVLKLSVLVLSLTALVGCSQFADLEDAEGSRYEAEYAVPLLNTSFSMNDLLDNFEENSVLTVLPDGLLRLQYTGSVLTESADDVFEAINSTLASLGGIPIEGSSQALPFSGPDGLVIDQMDLKAGNMFWTFVNCHDKAIDATITFPTVQRDGVPLTINRTLEAYSGEGDCPSRNNFLSPINLANYSITTVNDSIYVEYYAEDTDGMEVAPATGTLIGISELAFSYAEGYLGQINHSSDPDSIEIDFFDNWIRGDVFFEDPVITFNFENSFGIPTRAIIDQFDVVSVDGTTLPLESDFIDEGIEFPFPTLNQVGEATSTNFVFNKDNSNIREILSAGPIAINYDVSAATNPDGDTEIRGFVTDSSYYRVLVEVDLPLYGWAINFGVRDTFDLSLSDLDNADYAEFKMVTENAMPVAIGVQGYFRDDAGNALDSLYDAPTRVIAGAPVGADGRPAGVQETVTFSDFPADRFTKIKGATQLEVVATFFTTTDGEQSVQILNDQDVKVKVGAILGVSGN
ncbi:MAG: hypothetical protein AAFO03_13340 [Bacteroidota bacterium]